MRYLFLVLIPNRLLFRDDQVPAEKRDSLSNPLSLGILAAVTGVALVLKDLSFVLSFGGATLGNAIVFLFPVIMFNKAVTKFDRKDLKKEASASKLVAIFGIIMGAIGARQALVG